MNPHTPSPRPALARGFRLLLALASGLLVSVALAQTPTAVPTFHAIGLYWQPAGGATTNACTVEYRPVGTTPWFTGMNLWFDSANKPTAAGTTPVTKDPARVNEYRGSIVDLAPGTNYEIKLTLASGPTQTITCATLAENFWNVSPVSVTPLTSRTTQLVITTGGNPSTGRFAIYDGANGGGPGINATIDLSADQTSPAVSVQASYVVLRNCTIVGGRHGIQLGDGTSGTATTVSPTNDVHHIVIENCDISGWGKFKLWDHDNNSSTPMVPSVWGENYDSGIFAQSRLMEHVIVQRNKIHDPRTRANSWKANVQTSALPSSSIGHHPQGPQGITWRGKDQPTGFVGTAGHHIIRYNEIWGTDGVGEGNSATAGHAFNDGIGGDDNRSFNGFPGRDSDVYCNYIANCWDDAIEAEGGNMNVRIWGNFVDYTFLGFAHAGASLGPLYSFRNITGFTRDNPQRAEYPVNNIDTESPLGGAYPTGGGIYKLGWSSTALDGWQWAQLNFFHNTSLQGVFNGRPSGGGSLQHNNKPVENLVLRNNLFHLKWSTNSVHGSFDTISLSQPGNHWDYDQTNGGWGPIGAIGPGREANGLTASAPVYETFPGPRAPEMMATSPGRDTAVVLPNFSDFFNNGGPDRGAIENSKGLVPVGVSADWSDYLINPSTNTLPRITTLTLPAGKVGQPYSTTLVASGGTGTITWKLRDGALPAGFTLSSSGVLSGPAQSVPLVASFVVAAGDSDSIHLPDFATQGYILWINPLDDTLGPVIAPLTVRSGTDSQPQYTFTVPYGASATNLTTRVVSVTLLDGAGTQQGSPRVPGALPSAGGRTQFLYTMPKNVAPATDYQWKIELKTSTSGTVLDTQIISPVNVLRQAMKIEQTTVPGGTVGVAYSKQLTAKDEVAPITWSYTGSLPPGITMSSSGLISGTPTAAGTFTFTAKVTDSLPSTDTETMDLVVTGGSNSVPSITTTSVPNATSGVAYNETVVATGGDGALVWTLDSGALPSGVTLSSSGVLSGTPTEPGAFSFTVRVADSDTTTGAADEDTQALTLTVDPRVISVNSTDSANTLAATEVVGFVAVANWNNSTVGNEALANVNDSTGAVTTADVSFGTTSFSYNNNTTGTTGDVKMMRSQRSGSNTTTMTATAAQVPYATYDVYVYWGGRTPLEPVPMTMTVNFQLWNGTAWVTSETKYIKDSNRVWDGTYNESLATTAAAAVDGEEYVVFRNVTATGFRISATSGVRTGICGLQIVER